MTTTLIILFLLAAPLALGTLSRRLTSWPRASSTTLGSIGIALVFGFTAVGHFLLTEPMAAMLPPWVPGRVPLVYATGVLEGLLAITVLRPQWRYAAAGTLLLLLVLFLPANIYAALHRVPMGGHEWGPVYLLIRIPLQVLLFAWVWWFAFRPLATAPVTFCCTRRLAISFQEIARQMLDLERWPEFRGYGPLPGIRSAEFINRAPDVVRTRIRVTCTDGSSHVEEIVSWDVADDLVVGGKTIVRQTPRVIAMRLSEFSPPLNRLATEFHEIWTLAPRDGGTDVVRALSLLPKSAATRPLLWLISLLLRRAIARHLAQLDQSPP